MPAKSAKDKWLEFVVTTPSELSEAIADYLTEMGSQGVIQEETALDPFSDKPAPEVDAELKAYLPWGPQVKKQIAEFTEYLRNIAALFPDLEQPSFSTNTIVDPDWAEQWKKYFKPLRISRDIVIKPTWERYAPRGRDIVIDIDPGMAFGTGQHPSTRLCIIALQDLIMHTRAIQKWEALDVGTGTGILAISCAKLGVEKVVAVDLDAQAVEIAIKNIAINEVGNTVEVINRDVSMCKGTFDLIIANLSVNALISLKSHLVHLMKPDGYIIMSGIMDKDTNSITHMFHAGELTLENTFSEKEWVCHVFKKRSTSR